MTTCQKQTKGVLHRASYQGSHDPTQVLDKAYLGEMRIRSIIRTILGTCSQQQGIELHPTKIKNLMTEQEPRTIKDVQSLIGKIMAQNRFIPRVSEKCRPFYKAIKCAKEIDWGEEQKKALEQVRKYLNTTIELSVPEQ